jgi:hypothetical protein
LGALRLSDALPALYEELQRVLDRKRLNLAHGSEIVKAFLSIRDPKARPTLLSYADALLARIPSDPEPRRYFEERIREARSAAARLE